MKNLVVQLFGIGNLVQTEPLMRALGEGDILVDPKRSTHELAPLFPKWKFVTDADLWRDNYDDVYLCHPAAIQNWRDWLQLGRRIHCPVWYREGGWEVTEAVTLGRMADRYIERWGDPSLEPDFPRGYLSIPKLIPPVERELTILNRRIGVSLGYLRSGGWDFKNWGGKNLSRAICKLQQDHHAEIELLGTREELLEEGLRYSPDPMPPLWEQVKVLAGCRGYLGNDTGFGHLAGAFGLPSAIYTVTDKVKNRTAAPKLLQFGRETSPEEAVDWLLEAIREEGHGEEESEPKEGEGDPPARRGSGAQAH